jgi:hypothetical protein
VKRLLFSAVLLMVPALSFAQSNPGPFGGLFGRTPPRTGTNSEIFEIRGSGGWQWNDVLSEPRPDQPPPPFAGQVGYTAVSSAYDRQTDRLNLQAGSRAEFRNSFTDRTRGTTYDAGFALNSRLTTRLSAESGVSYRRSPFFQFYPVFAWTGDDVVIPGVPYDVQTVGYHTGEARVGASLQYSKSSSIGATASRSEMWLSTAPKSNVSIASYHGLWSRRINRDFSVRLGYGHREFRHQTATVQKVVEEEIDAGVDFHRALTVAPRTTLGFMTHTSIVRRPNQDTLYRLNGEFQLTRFFQRTWKLQMEGRRATEMLAGFTEPLFTDSLALSVGGLLSRRLQWMTVLSGQHGRFGYDAERAPFTVAGASTHLTVAVSRRLGVFSQYGFYRHDAPTGAFTVAALGDVSRQTFTVGIVTWLPLYVRERTPSDSR